VVAGCKAYDDNSLVIVDTEAITTMTNCIVPAMPTAGQTEGVLDVGVVQAGIGSGYVIAPILLNNLVERATTTNPERDGITVIGFDLEIHGPSALPISNPQQTTLISGPYLLPSNTAGTAFEGIPYATALELAQSIQPGAGVDVVVQFRAKGRRADGEIDSGYTNFPVHVCNGCLTGGPIAACPVVPPMMSQVALGGCNPSQDVPITCCTQANATLCGSAVPTSMGGM
jgi:hypothetical protein